MKEKKQSKGIIRSILLIFFLFGLIFFIYDNINFDKEKPNIKYLNNQNIYNKNLENFLLLKDKKSYLYSIKLFYSSKDTNFEWIEFYSKSLKGFKKKEYSLKLNNTKLHKFFSSNIKNFKLKVIAIDNSFSKNTTVKVYSFDIDNFGPKIELLKKSMNLINSSSIISLKLKITDFSGINNITINNSNTFLLKKDINKNIYSIIYFFNKKDLKRNFIYLKIEDKVGNSNFLKIYFIKSKKKIKIKEINFNNKIFNELKNLNTDLKENKSFNFLKKKLNEEIVNINKIINIDIKNNIKKNYYFDNIKFNNFFNTKDKILFNNFPGKYSFIFSNRKLNIKMNSIFYKINRYKKIYPVMKGKIIYISNDNIFNNYIILKHLNGFYSVYFFLTVNKNLKIGENINNNTPLGKPKFNKIFNSNAGLKLFFLNKPINSNYFIKEKYFNLYINKIIN